MAKKVKEVIAIIEANGWYHHRTTGGHRIYKHPHHRTRAVISGKPSANVPAGTLAGLRRLTGLEDLR